MNVELVNVNKAYLDRAKSIKETIFKNSKKIKYSNNSLASCICVTYNRPDFLNELLFCFLNQDYENKELIIVNDQKNVVYYYDDPRVKIYNLPQRFSTLGEKRQFANERVNGGFILTMDDDDIYFSKHINTLINIHLNQIYWDIVAPRKYILSQDNENIRCDINHLVLNGACVKREYINNNVFPKTNRGEDVIFTSNAKFKYVDYDTTFYYRYGISDVHITDSFNNIQDMYDVFGEKGETLHSELIEIELKPELTEKTKKIYR